MICSTLSGHLAIKHPTLGVLVREDGFVYRKLSAKYYQKYSYTSGSINSRGYLKIKINGMDYQVHRLVAECFIPNPDNRPTVDHINRNRTDNNVTNLRWATYREQALNKKSTVFGDRITVNKCENPAEYQRQYRRLKRESNL